jgi:hypothetical protein
MFEIAPTTTKKSLSIRLFRLVFKNS